ncbi:succinylglutamate desuccinylase/aspartoacylase family protein [Craterilacuibacter sp.]|uniref:succinylglutamate desuccinylase/aspartoacylase family protein n=1 Tax=Craterilacuibacter sp. TaxID=2870909 RepID=UPI003F308966
MHTRHHVLPAQSLGSQRTIQSLHFGTPGQGPKVYIQAGLHADEIPGLLVCHHLRTRLIAAEAAGRIQGEVVLVPVANPIGLAQTLMHDAQGRFDFASGENFNRGYPDFYAALGERLAGEMGADGEQNKLRVRAAMAAYLAQQTPHTELEGLRHALVSLAFDADVVLDLHADFEAVLHLYTETPYLEQLEPLTRLLGAEAVLHAKGSGGQSFDEAMSQIWWQLAEQGAGRFPLPLACLAVTVELRSEAAVSHALATVDADRIFDFLVYRGVVAGEMPVLPPLRCLATPLAGSEPLIAVRAGVVIYRAEVGETIAAGQVVCELLDPQSGEVTLLRSTVSGVLYARASHRYAVAGRHLGKIAGGVAFRHGCLLSA